MTFVVGAGQSQRSKGMPERLGKYELLAPLAQGGTAEVFLARLSGAGGFEKVVVVKRLLDHLAEDREFVGMFLDEARLGARLDQSNIVQTIELGCVDGQYFIAMEYLAGMSLAHLAKKVQEPGVIDMRVREQQEIDAARVEGQRLVVEVADGLVALEHAAIDKELPARMDDSIARPGDGPRRHV